MFIGLRAIDTEEAICRSNQEEIEKRERAIEDLLIKIHREIQNKRGADVCTEKPDMQGGET